MVLSADSALLNQHKPFFLPDHSTDIRYTPSKVVRISRLGKHIAPKFADRYYDATAEGADFIAWDLLQEARQQGHSWTEAVAFDGSLGVDEWVEREPEMESGHGPESEEELIIPIAEAIATASRTMTIRQGDLIYIHKNCNPIVAEKEHITNSGNKIK